MTAVFGGIRVAPTALDRRSMVVCVSRRVGTVRLGGGGGLLHGAERT